MKRPCDKREWSSCPGFPGSKRSPGNSSEGGERGEQCYKMKWREGGSQILCIGPTKSCVLVLVSEATGVFYNTTRTWSELLSSTYYHVENWLEEGQNGGRKMSISGKSLDFVGGYGDRKKVDRFERFWKAVSVELGAVSNTCIRWRRRCQGWFLRIWI